MATFNGDNTSETITGTSSADSIFGNGGDDIIDGGGGNDNIDGGTGNDTLTGGANADNFNYTTRGFGSDVITDFTVGTDKIDFSAIFVSDMSMLTPYMTQVGANTRIQFVWNSVVESVTINNTTIAALTSANFNFNTLPGGVSIGGGSGDDTLFGGVDGDTLFGGGGNDSLNGGGGNDFLSGQGGNDTLRGGLGADNFRYTARQFGADVIEDFSAAQGDVIDVSTLGISDFSQISPYISSASGGAWLTIGYNNVIESILIKGVTPAQLTASNFLFYTGSPLAVTGTAGFDFLFGTAGNDLINGGDGVDTIQGGAGADTIRGEAGNDNLYGGAGADDFGYVGRGASLGADTIWDFDLAVDQIDLSADLNVSSFDQLTPFMTNTANGAQLAFFHNGVAETITLRNVTTSQLTAANFIFDTSPVAVPNTSTANNDVLFGHIGADSLSGAGGDDILVGGDGADSLDGGTGVDALRGGKGNDLYRALEAIDVIVENVGEGFDTVEAGFSYTLAANVEKLVQTGVSAINGTGNSLDNELVGNNAANVLSGGAGSDILIGNAGIDTLTGGGDEDTFRYLLTTDSQISGFDTITDFQGNVDTIDVSAADQGQAAMKIEAGFIDVFFGKNSQTNAFTSVVRVQGDIRASDIVTSANGINVFGSGADDTIISGTGSDFLFGDNGNDFMVGQTGADRFVGGAGADTFFYGAATDTLVAQNDIIYDFVGNQDILNVFFGDQGQVGMKYEAGYVNVFFGNDGAGNFSGMVRVEGDIRASDILTSTGTINVFGSTGDDTLISGVNDDFIFGDLGADFLVGQTGADRLLGGGGADTFFYGGMGDTVFSARDQILDFDSGVDNINVFFADAGQVGLRYMSGYTEVYFGNDGSGNFSDMVEVYGEQVLASDIVTSDPSVFIFP